MAQDPAGHRSVFPTIERVIAIGIALVVVGLIVYLIIRNEPIADPDLVVPLRILLSFAMAVLGATIPGFLNLSWKAGGLTVRAAGALALFVFTFWATPQVLKYPSRPALPSLDLPTLTPQLDAAAIATSFIKNAFDPSVDLREVVATVQIPFCLSTQLLYSKDDVTYWLQSARSYTMKLGSLVVRVKQVETVEDYIFDALTRPSGINRSTGAMTCKDKQLIAKYDRVIWIVQEYPEVPGASEAPDIVVDARSGSIKALFN